MLWSQYSAECTQAHSYTHCLVFRNVFNLQFTRNYFSYANSFQMRFVFQRRLNIILQVKWNSHSYLIFVRSWNLSVSILLACTLHVICEKVMFVFCFYSFVFNGFLPDLQVGLYVSPTYSRFL